MASRVSHGELLELEDDNQLAHLVSKWDFSLGRKFEESIFRNFRSSVHHPSSSLSGAFHLLVIFRRYTFRLTEGSVSLALHSALGGSPAGFHVTYLKDRHYRFSVASKRVGFAVQDIKHIVTDHFDIYFHLWRDGGENWLKEWRKWQEEEDNSWTLVSRHKPKASSAKRVSFSPKLIQDSPPLKFKPQMPSSSSSCFNHALVKFGDFAVNVPISPKSVLVNPNLNSNLKS
jgi:hypothetical protein